MRRPSLPQSIALLLAVSVVAGVLMAGILLPFVGGAGLAARTATNYFDTLPAVLKHPPLPQVSTIVADDGTKIASFYDQDRVVVPLAKIPLTMQLALIDVEDVRFYEHGGIDFKGTVRALLHNGSSGAVTQGGSTLTQQLIKNILIEKARTKKERAAAIADTLARKVREARYAIEYEQLHSKSQILDQYLNIAYFGDGAYGIGAAARHYFNEPVTALTVPQSALLAGLVQSPEAYNPRYYPALAKERRDTVLAQMLKYQSINQAQYDAAIATPIKLHIHTQGNDCVASHHYGYFCDYVKNVFKTTPGLGLSLLNRGGLTVTTTLDPTVQQAATKGLHQYVHAKEPDKVVSAEAVVQPGTGQVKALAVSQPYGNNAKRGQNSINYAVDQKYGGSPGFHAGSTFKLFVLAAALKQGIPLSTTINSPGSLTNVTGYATCSGAQETYPEVSNAEPGDGSSYNLESGTWYSVNTFFAQLEQRTGLCMPVKLAEAMGVTQGTGKPPLQVPSFVLGSGAYTGFTPLDLAGAYATMAAHGKYCSPIVITKIVDRSGNTYPVPKSDCTQVVQPGLANTITSILRGVLTEPGATGTIDALTDRPAAAKTGTVDNNVASWFAGYTPQLASAVWVGIPSHPSKSLNGLTIGGVPYGTVFGATIAGRIWQSTMNEALANQPIVQFSGPSSYYSIGISRTVPDVTGDSPGTAEATLSGNGFHPVIETGTVRSTEPLGTVARTSPGAGSSASEGATVLIYLSDGNPPATHTSAPPSSPPSSPSNTPTTPPVGPSSPPAKHPHKVGPGR